MTTEIITIGDELLIGQIADTNSQWIAKLASTSGFDITRITSIPDELDTIVSTLEESAARCGLVFVTGGLGPTKDDVTRKAISAYFDTGWTLNQKVYDGIFQFLKKRGIEMSELNQQQAQVPDKAEIFYNTIGTAPGMKLTKDQTVFVFMPGVQFEMKEMMQRAIIPQLKKLFIQEEYLHKIIITQGIPEAYLADKLSDWEMNLPDHIKVAYLPSPGFVKLRISTKGNNVEHIEKEIDKHIFELTQLIPEYFLATTNEKLEYLLGNTLLRHEATLSTAESCTGGMVAEKVTSIPGSSAYFKGSIVAYSNEVKQKVLNVNPETLADFGAVSKEVVVEMVQGVRRLFATKYAIAISGIAGPTGGTDEKPVGTTWIAVTDGDRIIANRYHFGTKRDVNIQKAANTAMGLLFKLIEKKI